MTKRRGLFDQVPVFVYLFVIRLILLYRILLLISFYLPTCFLLSHSDRDPLSYEKEILVQVP